MMYKFGHAKLQKKCGRIYNIGFDVNEYKPMIMGLEGSGLQISIDSDKSKLIKGSGFLYKL